MTSRHSRFLTIIAAVGFAAVSSRAQTVDWNTDPYSGLKAALSEPGAYAPATVQAAPAEKSRRGEGLVATETVSSREAFSLTREEIARALAAVPPRESALGKKMNSIMHRVYVSAAKEAPGPESASMLRVITWNVNDPYGDRVGAVASLMQGRREGLGKASAKILKQLAEASEGDVFLLQEMGLNAAIAAAQRLDMNLAWAPEFIEIGANAEGRNPENAEDLSGNAILSRYPLSDFRILRFADQADWYEEEKKDTPLPEKLKQNAGRKIFKAEANFHETRPPMPYGGRLALFARAAIAYHAAAGEGRSITFVNMHLENKAKPQLRLKQADEAIAAIKSLGEPVVFGGDFNTIGGDGRNSTVGRLLAGQIDTPGKIGNQGACCTNTLRTAKVGYIVATNYYARFRS